MDNKFTRGDYKPKQSGNKFIRGRKRLTRRRTAIHISYTYAQVFKQAIEKKQIRTLAGYIQRYRKHLLLSDRRIYKLAFDLTGIELENWDKLWYPALDLLGE